MVKKKKNTSFSASNPILKIPFHGLRACYNKIHFVRCIPSHPKNTLPWFTKMFNIGYKWEKTFWVSIHHGWGSILGNWKRQDATRQSNFHCKNGLLVQGLSFPTPQFAVPTWGNEYVAHNVRTTDAFKTKKDALENAGAQETCVLRHIFNTQKSTDDGFKKT